MTAIDTVVINADIDTVYDTLIDAWAFSDWVVGAQTVRKVDAGWPAVGTRFHHRVGVGPVTLADVSELLMAKRPR